jgi:hypothetical protein
VELVGEAVRVVVLAWTVVTVPRASTSTRIAFRIASAIISAGTRKFAL